MNTDIKDKTTNLLNSANSLFSISLIYYVISCKVHISRGGGGQATSGGSAGLINLLKSNGTNQSIVAMGTTPKPTGE